MTTRITVDAHAGWPVGVISVDRSSSGVRIDEATPVPPNEIRDFYVWEGRDLIIRELRRPDATIAPYPYPLDFGDVVRGLKFGKRFARKGWNGKGMWIALSGPTGPRDIPAENFWSPHNAAYARENGGTAPVLPCITMKNAAGAIVMGWLASQEDILAEDWQEVV